MKEKSFLKKHSFSILEWDDSKSIQSSLPLRKSGNGLRKHHKTCFFAFWGAAARAADYFSILNDDDASSSLKISDDCLYANHLLDTWNTISKGLPKSTKPFKSKFAYLPDSGDLFSVHNYYRWYADKSSLKAYYLVPKMQSNLSKLHNIELLKSLKKNCSIKTLARLTSCTSNQATKWMISPPPGAIIDLAFLCIRILMLIPVSAENLFLLVTTFSLVGILRKAAL